ncbi:MAG: Uracil DNA glycosylase superfamily protein [Elusimicrobia bacterium ADurb.Bin231]|nr:MAG: Uracil DNA glycosylase superfamily protein [Elusimicrobia bacterium ADurb.Bin231]
MNDFEETVLLVKKYAEQMIADGVKTVEAGEKIICPDPDKKGIANREKTFIELSGRVNQCKKCPLGLTRKNSVFGEGNINAKLMFIGEGPGYNEDCMGKPFVGRAGQLLDKIIKAMGFAREDVYITNIVKCHPMKDPGHPDMRGNDRKPTFEEIAVCRSYVDTQIDVIKPKIICALGGVAASALLNLEAPIGKLRGKFYDLNGIKLMPTYHPAALLRNESLKAPVWEDMKMIIKELQQAV